MTSVEQINEIVLADGVAECVNEGTEYTFPAFVEPGRLEQAQENAARLAGYGNTHEAVRGVPKRYISPGEDRPDGDTDPVVAMRRLLRDGPCAGQKTWTGDEEDAAWLPRLIAGAKWIIVDRRRRHRVGSLIADVTAIRLAVSALYARTTDRAAEVLAELDSGMHDDHAKITKADMLDHQARLVERYRAVSAPLMEDNRRRQAQSAVEASYRRQLGDDESAWPEHVREFVASGRSRLMSADQRDAAYEGLLDIGRQCREAGATPDSWLVPKGWADFDRRADDQGRGTL